MACFHPRRAWRVGDTSHVQFFWSPKAGAELLLPCGECVGCLNSRAQEWATRCHFEALSHPRNEFVTLTYDDKHLPPGGSLRYEDFQRFVRSLRDSGRRLRYFGAGEYGTRFQRPHFHACLFGVGFDDRVLHSRSPAGERVYRSDELSSHWPHGFAATGNVTLASAAYIARYILQKGRRDDDRYRRVDSSTGEVFYVEPEFNFMSLKPGIGLNVWQRYGQAMRDNDNVVIEGSARPIPKYFLRVFARDAVNLPELAEIQSWRWERMTDFASREQPSLDSREKVQLARFCQLNRTNVE